MRNKVGIVGIIAMALLSSGCTADVLGRLKGFDVIQIIQSAPVAEAVQKAKVIGRTLAGMEALILAFVCWYRIHTGGHWLNVTKDWFLGILVCAFVLTTAGTSAGVEQWIWKVGVYLGEQFTPAKGFLMENYNLAVGRAAQTILMLQNLAATNPGGSDGRVVEAVAWLYATPYVAVAVAINSVAIYVMKMVMQISYAWLISFYWMLTPIVAPMVILPQTRGVFVGWLKSFISICLWPMFFAFAERLALAIPWNAWIGTTDGAGSPFAMVGSIVQSELMMIIFNVAFFFVYLSIPIASHLIVSGASRPFRNL
jgi:hypothetical protein